MRLRSQAIRVYNYAKIPGPRFQRNYIIAKGKKSPVWTDTFPKSSQFNLSQAFFAKHAWLRSRNTILSRGFHGLRKERLTAWPPGRLPPPPPPGGEKRVADYNSRCLRVSLLGPLCDQTDKTYSFEKHNKD